MANALVLRQLAAAFASSALASTFVSAQCGFAWRPGAPASGPNGPVRAVLVEPGGSIIAAGDFGVADAAMVNCIARWNGTAWQAIGGGMNNPVSCLARLPNGDLVAGGFFTEAGGQPANRIARWDGAAWAPIGTGFDTEVRSLLVLPNGDLIAGGLFTQAGGVPARGIARWNGTAWSAIGTGFPIGVVSALAVRPNGDLVAGGAQLGWPANGGVARWDGTGWQPIAAIASTSEVSNLFNRPNGDLVIGGRLTINGQVASLATFNGATVLTIPAPPSPYSPTAAFTLLGAANGDLVFGSSGVSLSRWNGSVWTPIAGAPTNVLALAEDPLGRLIVGSRPDAGAGMTRAVARYNGAAWATLGASVPPIVNAMVRLAGGDVVVGGSFSAFGGVAMANLARWNGNAWVPLGGGVDGPVTALAATPAGGVVASGNFANAGGAPASRVAVWDGQAWAAVGAGLPQAATIVLARANGEILAASGQLGTRRWSAGSGWTSMTIGASQAMLALPNGDALLGGAYFGFGGSLSVTGLLRLNAAGALSPIAGAPPTVTSMVLTQSGAVVVGPNPSSWDGANWTSLPQIHASSLGMLPSGELLATGDFVPPGGVATTIARLRSTWEPFAGIAGGRARRVATSADGDLFVAGDFNFVNGQVASGFAHAEATCPAATAIVGSGCNGGAGPVALSAASGPWLGGVFAATATGMTANSLALQVIGLQSALLPLPGGAPGCSLLLSPDVTDVLVPANGAALVRLQVPTQPSLAGRTFRMQVVGIELAAAGIVRLTSTNGLQLTIGAL